MSSEHGSLPTKVSLFCAVVRDLVLQIEIFDRETLDSYGSPVGENARQQRFVIYERILEALNDYEGTVATVYSAELEAKDRMEGL